MHNSATLGNLNATADENWWEGFQKGEIGESEDLPIAIIVRLLSGTKAR
jgi:hypothetical protein